MRVKNRRYSVWGHNYEFDVDGNWDVIEALCKRLAGRSDIFFGTNSEVLLDVNLS